MVAPSSGQGRWRPDERVIIADFSRIDAVAVGRSTAFGASVNGLVIYDRRFNRWQPPVTYSDGYPPVRALAAAVDPADESLWLAGRTGLLHYRPELREFEEISLPGGATELGFDRDDPLRGLYLRGPGGWQLLGRGQLVAQPAAQPPRPRWVGSVPLSALLRQYPVAETMGVSVLLDRQLRQYHYTAAALAPEGSEVFFGTDGLGLIRLDVTAARLDRLPFGFAGSRIGAVAPAPDGVWVAVEDLPGGGGFTVVDPDLTTFRDERDPTYPVSRVRDVAVRGRTVWAATDRGLLRIEPGGRWRSPEGDAGRPGPGATAVAGASHGVWGGSDRGLAFVGDDGSVRTVGPAGLRVLALLSAHDSAWVGTAQGLLLALSDTGALVVPAAAGEEPLLRSPIVALARSGETLVAATPERLLWERRGSGWSVEPVLGATVGPISALCPDSGGVWVGGGLGIAFFRFAGRGLVAFRAPDDVPGPVRDLAVSGPYLWVATERGLVRFTRRALVP